MYWLQKSYSSFWLRVWRCYPPFIMIPVMNKKISNNCYRYYSRRWFHCLLFCSWMFIRSCSSDICDCEKIAGFLEYWHFTKNRIWCRQLRNVVNFSHATQKPQRLPPLGFSCINENYDRYKKRSCMEFHTASWPVRESNPGLRRERASSWPLDQQAGIEATRFELATSASRTQRSTKLSHASMSLRLCVLCCSPATRI